MKPVPVLETPRLLLRLLRLGGAPRIQEFFPHYEIVKHMTSAIPWPYPDNGAVTFLSTIMLPGMAQGNDLGWALTLKSAGDDMLIGIISLHGIQKAEPTRGFWVGLPWQKQGLMTEAVEAVTTYALTPSPEGLGLDALYVNTAIDNTGSARLKEKTGAEIVRYEDHDYVAGRLPSAIWKISAKNWKPSR